MPPFELSDQEGEHDDEHDDEHDAKTEQDKPPELQAFLDQYGDALWDIVQIVLLFMGRNKLTKVASENLFRLINQLLLFTGAKITLPSFHEVMKLVEHLNITKIEKIDCCPDDHILFRGKYASFTHCPVCKVSRLVKGKPHKQFIYIGIKDQLRARFKWPGWTQSAQLKAYENTDILSDVSTGRAWQQLLASNSGRLLRDSRNQCLGLCMDGANPFMQGNAVYSYTPILMQMFNLPVHLRKKIENMLMVGIIPGPKAPKSFQPYLEW